MSKTKKILKKNLVTKHTGFAFILLIILSFLFIEFGGIFIIDFPLMLITNKMISGFGSVLTSLLFILFFKRYFYPEFSGMLTKGKIKTALKISLILIIYFIIDFTILFLIDKTKPGKLTSDNFILILSICLMAGFAEETVFRGVGVSYLMRQLRNNKHRIILVVIITSAVFGLTHLTNLSIGTNGGYILFQTISAALFGVFFCALFLRSGIIWPCILLHFLNDFLSFLFSSEEIQNNPLTFANYDLTLSNYIDFGFCIILAAIGFYLVRPSKHQEIDELWAKKWQKRKIGASACLLGENCKYDGNNNFNQKLADYIQKYNFEVIPVCPEVEGGLPTPRTPSEIVNGKVTNQEGKTVDDEFRTGAKLCLEKIKNEKVEFVVLQSRSPSCGTKQIYDGTFSKKLIKGKGVFAKLLDDSKIRTVDIEDL